MSGFGFVGFVRLEGDQVQVQVQVQLLGGAPLGRDDLNKLVSSWAGWRRRLAPGKLPSGEACSVYQARLWPSTVLPLLQTTLRLTWANPDLQGHLQAVMGQAARAKLELEPPASHHGPLRWADEWARAPMKHQVHAVRAVEAMGFRAILADDMGLGKTASSIYAWQQSARPRLLVVCPKTVRRNWEREIGKALADGQCAVAIIDGSPKQRADVISRMRYLLDNPDEAWCPRNAAIINYDVLHRLPPREVETLAAWVAEQALILDESHYVKNRKAERTKAIIHHLAPPTGGAAVRLCLSGTPIRNTLEDLYSQVEIVRPGTWSSFGQFDKLHLVRSLMQIDTGKRKRDGTPIKATLHPVRASRNREQLNAIVNTLQIRRMKEDVIDLPPKTFSYPEFELDPPTARIYRTMKEQALIELAELGADTPIFAPGAHSALEATLRLEQIAQGFLGGIPEQYLELVTPHLKGAEKISGRPGQVVFPRSAKIEWLRETIDSIILQGGRPVVFSRFNSILFWLVQQWEGAEVMHGGTSDKDRNAIIDRFQARGIPVLFCQVKIAEGWNATASQDVILYGRDWSPAINAQAVDRCHRMGQTGTVNVQVPIVHGTFEAYLHKKLRAKDADAAQALKSMTIGELREAL